VKTLFSIEMKHGVPRLVVHEKYEKATKWVLRGIAAIGIAISALAFSHWYVGVVIAILILAIQQFFERTVFEYTAIHVSAMPRRYDPAQWLAVAFAFSADTSYPDIIGPAFKDKAYAEEILRVIRSWNYEQDEDEEDYIRLSFILENADDYSIYIYPATNRPSAREFYGKYEEESKATKQGKRLMRLSILMTFCKIFPRKGSLLPRFHERNRSGRPFLLTTFFQVGAGYSPLTEEAVLKSHYKLTTRELLSKDAFEFAHGKRVMKK
jgi:hypothetical protein